MRRIDNSDFNRNLIKRRDDLIRSFKFVNKLFEVDTDDYIKEYDVLSKEMTKTYQKMIECQNKLNDLLQTIDKEKKNLRSQTPIVVKVSPDIDDKEIKKISEVLLSNNVAAVIVSNTSDSTRDDLKNTQSYQKGGLSGKPIELKSTELIGKFYNILKGRIKIIGVGGVDSGKSAYEKFLAGANYVQLYTGMVFRGPNIVNLIKKELKELLLVDGVKNYSEIVGKTK